MIVSFADEETKRVFDGHRSREFAAVQAVAERKMRMLNRAHGLMDLREPPGNRLEALKGKRAGQFSIRINDQYRVCFRWENDNAYEVEIVDYH